MVLIKLNKREIKINVRKLNEIGKFIGLMFRTRQTKNLLFSFNKKKRYSIHSLFVFFDFMAIWLDGKNNVLEWKIAKPFSFYIAPKKPFSSMIELPFNKDNKKLIDFIVDKGKDLNSDDALYKHKNVFSKKEV